MISLIEAAIERFRPQARALSHGSFGFTSTSGEGTRAGVVVNDDTAMRMSAVWAAHRLLSADISALPVDAFRRRNAGSELIKPQPSWLSQPVPADANLTIVEHFAQVVLSLVGDGNAFIVVLPTFGNTTELRVLDPTRVDIRSDGAGVPSYILRDARGQSVSVLGPMDLIHIPYFRKAGRNRGLSPIQALAETIGAGIAAEEFSSMVFSKGANMSGIIQIPREAGEPTDEQLKRIKQQFTKSNTGLHNSHAVGVLSGGAQWMANSFNPRDALLIEEQKWSVEQVARAYGIPPHLLGSQEPGAQAYASVEQKSQDYVDHALLPLVKRIESAYSRLLPRGSFLKFNLRGLLRADAGTRAQYYSTLLGTGAITPNRIAALEDEEPFDGGDQHYIAANNLQALDANGLPIAPATGAPAQ